MEQRTITILDTAASKKVDVITDATTLGQLKEAARAAGINVENKDWKEGNSQVLLLNDDSLLPTNVRHIRTGQVTNNLAFMLTNSNTKIDSGADRAELYAKIKKYNLQDTIKHMCGKNYTQVKTDYLETFVREAEENIEKTKETACNDCSYKDKYIALVNGIVNLLTKNADDTVVYSEEDLNAMLMNL